jgi:hypothetical protein
MSATSRRPRTRFLGGGARRPSAPRADGGAAEHGVVRRRSRARDIVGHGWRRLGVERARGGGGVAQARRRQGTRDGPHEHLARAPGATAAPGAALLCAMMSWTAGRSTTRAACRRCACRPRRRSWRPALQSHRRSSCARTAEWWRRSRSTSCTARCPSPRRRRTPSRPQSICGRRLAARGLTRQQRLKLGALEDFASRSLAEPGARGVQCLYPRPGSVSTSCLNRTIGNPHAAFDVERSSWPVVSCPTDSTLSTRVGRRHSMSIASCAILRDANHAPQNRWLIDHGRNPKALSAADTDNR